jgi:hypothetical protein
MEVGLATGFQMSCEERNESCPSYEIADELQDGHEGGKLTNEEDARCKRLGRARATRLYP